MWGAPPIFAISRARRRYCPSSCCACGGGFPQNESREVGTVIQIGDGIARVDPQGIRTLFEFCLSIRPICELLYDTGHQEVILRFYLQGAAPVIAQADAKTYYFIQFITFGLFGLMNAWVLGGYKETPEEMAQIVCAWKDASQEA